MKTNGALFTAAAVAGLLLIPRGGKAQPVSDRAVVPLAVTLNEVLRINISNGGNIEFVFNQIGQYETGINASGGTAGVATFYLTQFNVSSSRSWELGFGSEDPTPINGTDNPANTFAANNIGFRLFATGTNTTANALADSYSAFAGVVTLPDFPTILIDQLAGTGAISNAGNDDENAFRIEWRVGTVEGTMNAQFLIDQNPGPNPDRYVTNVLFELAGN